MFLPSNRPGLLIHFGHQNCFIIIIKFTVIILPVKSTGISYIGVATSDSPLHEFTDHGPIVEYGKEAIDAFIYDDNGQLYISWKAYGLDTRPIELLGCKLSADGLHLDGEPLLF